jgi:hypothetical protein
MKDEWWAEQCGMVLNLRSSHLELSELQLLDLAPRPGEMCKLWATSVYIMMEYVG